MLFSCDRISYNMCLILKPIDWYNYLNPHIVMLQVYCQFLQKTIAVCVFKVYQNIDRTQTWGCCLHKVEHTYLKSQYCYIKLFSWAKHCVLCFESTLNLEPTIVGYLLRWILDSVFTLRMSPTWHLPGGVNFIYTRLDLLFQRIIPVIFFPFSWTIFEINWAIWYPVCADASISED